jgi:thioredoxin-related protein
MRKFKHLKLLVLAFIMLTLLSGCSDDLAVNNFVKGSFNQIKAQYQGQAHIIVFWSKDCAYCMKELSFLGDNLNNYPTVKLTTISADIFLDKTAVQKQMKAHNLDDVDAWVFSDAVAQKLYFDVDPRWHGELPLMYLIKPDNTIKRQIGYMKQEDLLTWLKAVS